MTKFIFPAIILALAFIACKKSTNTAPAPNLYGVTANINGVNTSFTAEITVDTSSTPGTVYIVAHSDTTNFTPLLEITLTGNRPLTAGVYPDTLTAGGLQGLVGYTAWSGATDEQYNPVTDTVTVTSVSKTALAGTFQGTCLYMGDTTFVSITNGKFNVPLAQQ
jgi:hypothetical protein